MGEYAKYKGTEIKIGTCEDMLYLRADQVKDIMPLSGSVNPRFLSQATQIRFRFPFPQEDGLQPEQFEPFRTLGVSGVDAPPEINHRSLQFRRNYPSEGGLLLSTPCPESTAGKASGLKFVYNGYSGKVQIVQQKLLADGRLVLVCRCGSCGAAYRIEDMEDLQPILDSLAKQAAYDDHQHKLAQQRTPEIELSNSGDYYREIIKRILDGYTQPNFWTEAIQFWLRLINTYS